MRQIVIGFHRRRTAPAPAPAPAQQLPELFEFVAQPGVFHAVQDRVHHARCLGEDGRENVPIANIIVIAYRVIEEKDEIGMNISMYSSPLPFY